MEEILASIRRIIADDAPKTPRSDGLRSDTVQSGATRIVGGRNSLRRTSPDQGLSGATSRLEVAVARIPQNDAAEDEPALPEAQSELPQPSRMFPETRPSAMLGRPTAPHASPSPEPGMQREEIEAFLAELGSSSSEASDERADTTDRIAATDALPEPEFAAPDHPEFAAPDDVIEPIGEEDEEEQSQAEPQEELPPPIAAPSQPQLQARAGAQPAYAQRPYEPDVADEALISDNTTAAVNSAFNTLAQTVLVQNGRTLEDLVREMLRPMLKDWLDDNLLGMVERLVRAEIERVSRGRG